MHDIPSRGPRTGPPLARMNASMSTQTATGEPLPLAYGMKTVAEITGLSPSKISKIARRGELRSVKVGTRRLILHEDLMTWLHSQRESAGTDDAS
jgi:excisionase family DNA binding protein